MQFASFVYFCIRAFVLRAEKCNHIPKCLKGEWSIRPDIILIWKANKVNKLFWYVLKNFSVLNISEQLEEF